MSRLLFIAAMIVAAPALAEARYFSELPDLPMPPGFTQTDTAVGFDSARGRLVVADASGAQTATEVRGFYAQTLPALGWAPSPTTDETMVFVRGRERLVLDVRAVAGRTLLHVQLVVRPPPSDGD